MIGPLKDAWSDVAARKEVAAAQFAGNLVLLAILYWWLGLGVGSGARVALVAVIAAAWVAASAWLHGASIAAFRPVEVSEAFSLALQRLLKLSAVTVILLLALFAWDFALAESARFTNWLASALTLSSQRPVKPEAVAWVLPWKLRAWFVLLGLLLTPIAACAVNAVESAPQVLRRPAYWAAGILLSLTGLYLPYLLINWIPATGSLALELGSASIRFVLAYVLAVWSWLTLAALVSRLGRPAA